MIVRFIFTWVQNIAELKDIEFSSLSNFMFAWAKHVASWIQEYRI
jgi:hypothetical protein